MILDRIDDLLRQMPVRPLVAQRVLESVEDPEASVAAIATVVSLDPGLSTRILRLANSAAHAGREPAVSVERAVMLLGIHTVRAIVAAGAFPLFRDDVDLGPHDFWGHALSVAAAASAAAPALGVSPDEAFTVGILHDIGRAVQHFGDREAFDALGRRWEPSSLLQRERAAFGSDHAHIGADAAARWGFPESLVEAIRDHHSPPRTVGRLTRVVMIGEAVAARLDDVAPTEPIPPLDALIAELKVPLRPDKLIRDTERRYERLAALAETA